MPSLPALLRIWQASLDESGYLIDFPERHIHEPSFIPVGRKRCPYRPLELELLASYFRLFDLRFSAAFTSIGTIVVP